MRVRLSFAAFVLVLGGCAGSRPIPVDGGPARAAEAAARDTLVERLARRAARRGDRTLDVLLLSGGGQHGAYGTGFLRGWQARPGAMPRFDLVTGVSTGSLQAPFAVVGTEAALAEATGLYRDAAERIAPRFDPFFLFRRTGGIIDASRLQATLRATAVPPEMAGEPGADALFDGPYMHRLDGLGASRAASDQPWDVAVRGCTPI